MVAKLIGDLRVFAWNFRYGLVKVSIKQENVDYAIITCELKIERLSNEKLKNLAWTMN